MRREWHRGQVNILQISYIGFLNDAASNQIERKSPNVGRSKGALLNRLPTMSPNHRGTPGGTFFLFDYPYSPTIASPPRCLTCPNHSLINRRNTVPPGGSANQPLLVPRKFASAAALSRAAPEYPFFPKEPGHYWRTETKYQKHRQLFPP